jgi:hypothetical protein
MADRVTRDTVERKIKSLTLNVWPDGITADELANHLEHVASMLRQGCHCGDVCPDQGRGWWNTSEDAEAEMADAIQG